MVAVTGRAMVSGPDDVTDADLAALGVDGWGHAHDPRVMTRLAGERGWVDVLDAVLLAEGTGAREPWLVDRARTCATTRGCSTPCRSAATCGCSASRATTRRC